MKDDAGRVVELRGTLDPDSRPGMVYRRQSQGQGHHPLGQREHAMAAEIRLYDRLFTVPNPDDESDGKTYRDYLNPDSRRYRHRLTSNRPPRRRSARAVVPVRAHSVISSPTATRPHAGRPVFNRSVTLRDTWAKQGG
ncbi:MAG: hypothetical protein LKM39_00660 [Chiayiivirga sp.]|nr:hypothetical protein [Chiayiivirga sp.]